MAQPPEITIEDEVLGNLRRGPLGPPESPNGTVADLGLPLEFLRRVADRVIQASFRERHRIVVGGSGTVEHQTPAIPLPRPVPDWVRVLPERTSGGVAGVECRPALRGFRAPILSGLPWPVEPPRKGPGAAAAKVVASRLARDGIDVTLKKVVDLFGWDGFVLQRAGQPGWNDPPPPGRGSDMPTPESVEPVLREIGIPTDLAGYLPSLPANFEALAESGGAPIRTLRLQLTGPGYYAGEGDGGSLDILRQLLTKRSGVHIVASVEARFVSGVLAHTSHWKPAPESRLTLVPEALPVSQWAQDNAKPGRFIRVDGTGDGQSVLLAPRWAGRGEDGGWFVPGDTFLIDGLGAAGVRCAQSPLLFEGGNAMVVEEAAGRRVLLVGEAEIHRNVSLGLSRDEVTAFFLQEFRADGCTVLPAVSFHIDLEVSARTRDGRVIAFVPDSLEAVKIVCRLAAERLWTRGLMSEADAQACGEAARAGRLPILLEKLGRVLGGRAVGPGHFPSELAMLFKDGLVDSGVGNLQRVLYVLDWISADLNRQPAADRHGAAYLRSIRRCETDRRVIHRQLKQLGWEVVAVPSLSTETLGINAVNGLHEPGRYFMPAYGGFFAPLDAEAASLIERSLGGRVEVVPILTGETQRRSGGLHCAVSQMV